jgi:hypothetical protein
MFQTSLIVWAIEADAIYGVPTPPSDAIKERWTTCTLTVADFGIHEAPLPDHRDPLLWRWEQLQAAIIRWARGAGSLGPEGERLGDGEHPKL